MGVSIEFVPLPLEALDALLAGDLHRARTIAGAPLSEYFAVDLAWLWGIRAEQLRAEPERAEWIARAALAEGHVVGAAGFHGPPDERGMVEVSYSVDPKFRRRGHAKAMLAALIARAREDSRVAVVRASVSPDNEASLATIACFGFTQIGEQWDDEDGLELLFELPANPELVEGQQEGAT